MRRAGSMTTRRRYRRCPYSRLTELQARVLACAALARSRYDAARLVKVAARHGRSLVMRVHPMTSGYVVSARYRLVLIALCLSCRVHVAQTPARLTASAGGACECAGAR